MYKLPIPYKGKNPIKTWDIKIGYYLDCTCGKTSTGTPPNP